MTGRFKCGSGSLAVGIALLALQLSTGGCEQAPTETESGAPDKDLAASLSASSQTAASVQENLDQLDLFQNPLSSLASDAGLYREVEFDGYHGNGMSFTAKSSRLAANFRDLHGLGTKAATASAQKERLLHRLRLGLKHTLPADDPGDTIAVEYFDGPDSTGLNALILVEPPDLVRFVSLRQYPPVLGQVKRRDQEIVLDTGGTLEEDSDDEYYSLHHEEEMFGGEVAAGTLAPVSGSGPMLPGVEVQAVYHVQNPRFHPLQAWTEAEFVLDLGEFRVEDDESIFSVTATVHWRSDAEHRASLRVPAGGPITPEAIVEARGEFTAAPTNHWLEEITDVLLAQVGDLEDETDDLLVEVTRDAVFDGTAIDGGSPRSHIHYLPDDPVLFGTEPCGGEATQEIYYPATWWLVHLLREADIECDGSGTLHELMEMRDGTSYERWITWDGSGGATITEQRQDGTVVSGSWSEATGEYAITTTYPTGHDPVARHQHGQVLADAVEAWDVVTWQDAHPDTTHFDKTGDETDYTVTGYKVRGELREDFTLSYQAGQQLTGSWSRSDGAFGDFTLEELDGGGRHLIFAAAEPEAPGNPSVEGEIWFAPDGSGTGTITITQYGTTITFEIEFGPDGTGTLTDGEGRTVPIG